jgi:hypothetical protein
MRDGGECHNSAAVGEPDGLGRGVGLVVAHFAVRIPAVHVIYWM